jgi:hypothetical protein
VTFQEYLISKKIDAVAFQQAEAEQFEEWQREFEQQSANSFTAQKLYLINPIRRKYPLKMDVKKPQ